MLGNKQPSYWVERLVTIMSLDILQMDFSNLYCATQLGSGSWPCIRG